MKTVTTQNAAETRAAVKAFCTGKASVVVTEDRRQEAQANIYTCTSRDGEALRVIELSSHSPSLRVCGDCGLSTPAFGPCDFCGLDGAQASEDYPEIRHAAQLENRGIETVQAHAARSSCTDPDLTASPWPTPDEALIAKEDAAAIQ